MTHDPGFWILLLIIGLSGVFHEDRLKKIERLLERMSGEDD